MKSYLQVLVILLIGGFASAAEDVSALPTKKLIDELRRIESQAPGLYGSASVNGFVGEDRPLMYVGGFHGASAPSVPPAMRELTRRGVTALPLLIDHLDDSRKTKLTVAKDIFLSRMFSDEYDPRSRQTPLPNIPEGTYQRNFESGYTVRVGDVCYFIIGQIVGRNLLPVRYQPPSIVVVNSPVESPGLVKRVKKDWGGLDETAHKASLLADAQAGEHICDFGPAFTRLRFYYPAEYAQATTMSVLKAHFAEFDAEENKTNSHPSK